MEQDLGYRQVDQKFENHNGLFRKVEMPMFRGLNPYCWIAREERYFRRTRYDHAARL